MKSNNFKDLSAADLSAKIAELKSELFNLRFQNATNQLENPMRIAQVRKDIARAKTVLREIEQAGKQA